VLNLRTFDLDKIASVEFSVNIPLNFLRKKFLFVNFLHLIRSMMNFFSLCPPGQLCRMHFWVGSTSRADFVTPSDRVINKMMVSRGDLQFNVNSKP
jgi:hypothetical protein